MRESRLLPSLAAAALMTAAAAPASTAAQECPDPPRQAQGELEVEARAAVGKLARVTGGDLSVRTRRTVKDLLARVPDANVVYLEQMLFAAYCTAVRDDSTLTRAQRADRLARYARELRAVLPRATSRTPGVPGTTVPGTAPPGSPPSAEAARQRARDSLAFEGVAATDTAEFFRRVRARDLAVVRLFLASGLSPNVLEPGTGARGGPPLTVAAARGDSATATLLLKAGARPDLANRSGYTPLVHAAGAPSGAVTRLLLARGADVTRAADDGTTALHLAAGSGDTAVLGLLLGALPPSPRRRALLEGVDGAQKTALHHAAEGHHVGAARALLRAGAPADVPAERPPLCSAVERPGGDALSTPAEARAHRERALALARLLVEEGGARADPPCDGHSVLVPPLAAGDTVLAGYLLARGADPNRSWSVAGPPVAELAGRCGSDDTPDDVAGLRYLLAHGARADGRSGSGDATALMSAAARDGRACAEALLGAGADVNARSVRRATPLMWAADHGDPRVLALLLARGADARATDRDGETALTWLVDRPRRTDRAGDEPLEAVELLLRAGVDPKARRADGKSASDLARDAGYCAVAARLGGGCAR